MSEESPRQAQLHAVVSGHVQGVGFRYFVLEQAHRLNLTGWVRNTRSGQVEVLAEGDRDDLEALVKELQRGPASAYVKDVRADWQPASSQFYNFRVVHDF